MSGNVGPKRLSQVLVLNKVAAILDRFAGDDEELSLTELRKATGMPQSTTQRLVSNLVTLGFLDQQGDRYRIGSRIQQWVAPVARARNVVAEAQPILEDLRELTGETACLFRREGLVRVCVAMSETQHSLRNAMWVGRIVPLPAGSAGRVLCAWDPIVTDRLLQETVTMVTSDAVVDPATIRESLARTREQGWAFTSGERETGAVGVSAPIWDDRGRVQYALTLQAPAVRVSESQCEEWGPRLLDAARKLSHGTAPTLSTPESPVGL